MNAALQRETRDVLNGLIVACYDDVRVQTGAARFVVSERRRRLVASAERRTSFIHELGVLVREFGGEARQNGSASELILHSLARMRSVMTAHHVGDMYAGCARVERKTEALYASALDRSLLPKDVRIILERQHAEISSDCHELRQRATGGVMDR